VKTKCKYVAGKLSIAGEQLDLLGFEFDLNFLSDLEVEGETGTFCLSEGHSEILMVRTGRQQEEVDAEFADVFGMLVEKGKQHELLAQIVFGGYEGELMVDVPLFGRRSTLARSLVMNLDLSSNSWWRPKLMRMLTCF
jgi:hypothetical protein